VYTVFASYSPFPHILPCPIGPKTPPPQDFFSLLLFQHIFYSWFFS
jgi:hypothetical protein